MPGQMPGGKLNVSEYWVTEPAAADQPAEAIPQGGEFTLHAEFTGSGTQWGNMKSNKQKFLPEFHLEGIGATEAEVDYTGSEITLNAATDVYEAIYTVTPEQNTLPVGSTDVVSPLSTRIGREPSASTKGSLSRSTSRKERTAASSKTLEILGDGIDQSEESEA